MRVTFHSEAGTTSVAKQPYEGCEYVVIQQPCPVCSGKAVLIAHDIKETVIFAVKDLKGAEEHLKALGSKEWERVKPGIAGETQVRGVRADVGEYSATSVAACCRCHSHIGGLRAKFDTLFGITEDRLVLQGRPRVYE